MEKKGETNEKEWKEEAVVATRRRKPTLAEGDGKQAVGKKPGEVEERRTGQKRIHR